MAKEQMLRFVDLERETPKKRDAAKRRGDHGEIYRQFADERAREQAARCSQCGVPYCLTHCPLENNIPDWLKLTAENRLEEAYRTSQETNNFPEICGRICPQDRLCEGNCVIESAGHGTVTIGAVEKYLTDLAWERGWVRPRSPRQKREGSVAIIGAGPAGLAAGDELSARGYHVTIFDRHDRPGGLLTYGIPGFKLEKEIVLKRAELLKEQGVRFELNTEIGRDKTLQDLRRDFDAVLVATGVYKARELGGIASLESDRPVQALDYLIASNRAVLGDKVAGHEDGSLHAKGKKVIVIGGGDTAMDCVRTAIRQGAKSVGCLYRRDRENMPGSARETQNAEEEGVEFSWLRQPKALLSSKGKMTIRVSKMELGAPDASGRRSPVEVEGAEYDEPADLVITALGFEAENMHEALDPKLELTSWGTIKAIKPDYRTNLDGVFAAGDIVRGASLVVWAIREGREAAEGIAQYLRGKQAGEDIASARGAGAQNAANDATIQ